MLAAIDHNWHMFRQPSLSRDGNLKYNKVYSKRSGNWRLQVVKEEKDYGFWPTLASKVLQNRVNDHESLNRKVEISAHHPKNIAKSISMKPVPKTSDLLKNSLSRFVTKAGTSSSDGNTSAPSLDRTAGDHVSENNTPVTEGGETAV